VCALYSVEREPAVRSATATTLDVGAAAAAAAAKAAFYYHMKPRRQPQCYDRRQMEKISNAPFSPL